MRVTASQYVNPLLLADNVSTHCVFCVPVPCLSKQRTCRSNLYSSMEFVENSPSTKGTILLFQKSAQSSLSSQEAKKKEDKARIAQSNHRTHTPEIPNSKTGKNSAYPWRPTKTPSKELFYLNFVVGGERGVWVLISLYERQKSWAYYGI